MNKKWNVLLMAGILSVSTMTSGKLMYLEKVQAEGIYEEIHEKSEFELQLISNDEEKNQSLAIVKEASNGVVTGDGVRLRSQPSTSGAILEKMYSGEYVLIDWNQSKENGWYYLKRIKTGTKGWVSCNYISAWN